MTDPETELAGLATTTTGALRIAWRRLYGAAPPARLSRDLLSRAIAHKIQERAYGGLNPATKRRLRTLVRTVDSGAAPITDPAPALRPGARLIRTWRGQTHTVVALDDGFVYRGQRYRSLTQIAKRITGAHWSGPRFFGLIQAAGLAAPVGTDTPTDEDRR